MNHTNARERCDNDSQEAADGDDAVSGFLHLPMPRDLAENRLYASLPYSTRPPSTSRWADITQDGPNGWVFRDGSPVSWFSWWVDGEHTEGYSSDIIDAAVAIDWGEWIDTAPRFGRTVTCSYFLPAGSETICPWLRDFEENN